MAQTAPSILPKHDEQREGGSWSRFALVAKGKLNLQKKEIERARNQAATAGTHQSFNIGQALWKPVVVGDVLKNDSQFVQRLGLRRTRASARNTNKNTQTHRHKHTRTQINTDTDTDTCARGTYIFFQRKLLNCRNELGQKG